MKVVREELAKKLADAAKLSTVTVQPTTAKPVGSSVFDIQMFYDYRI